jgi:RNA chaperone Hfq
MTKLQQKFIDACVQTEALVAIFLSNGTKLMGYVKELGEDCLILERDGAQQLVLISAVATIMPVGLDGNR